MMKWAARERALSGYCAALRSESASVAAEAQRPLTGLALCLYRCVAKPDIQFQRN